MSRLTEMCRIIGSSSFVEGVAFENSVFYKDQYSHVIQWWTEGDTAWKQIDDFVGPSNEFVDVGSYDTTKDWNSGIGVDFSRNIVFFSAYELGLISCSFDALGTLSFINNNNVLSQYFLGKFGVDETKKLLFV